MNIKITDVRTVPGDSAFLIDNGKTAILYDSGFGFTGFSVAEKIKSILGVRSLDYVFLTHSHYDHVLGSAYVREYWKNVKVVAGEYAASIFAKPSAKSVMSDLDHRFAKKCGIDNYIDLVDNLSVDIPVKDGDIIKAGTMTFKAISLPGHTKCSFGFYCESEKLLLGSETLGVFDGEQNVVPAYLVGYKTTLESIKKALNLNIENILVPHYGILDKTKTFLYLSECKNSAVETAESILSILRQGGTKEDAFQWFKNKFYHGYIKEIYPFDAMKLNTSIMIDLIEKELM